ncbi:hypothetical protein KCTC52924_01222 [Arenibacter antarcticus]|uniref:DUF4153 domain-containing protein n=1 Tax=Arenibacter antarcticus TaxID=2040469 RepID=A0ABW5V9L2_9FLAO|nr:DUF4153 domain-containing protein [Arenibacter sp. H213]MCM4167958.1 hypothetical protein [Arenibacter sp. H213]
MNLASFKEISDKAYNAFQRFPITLLWTILGSIYCIYFIGKDGGDFFETHLNVFMTLVIGVSWLIAIQFLIEQFPNPKKWQWTKMVLLGLLFLFYWQLPTLVGHNDDPTYYVRFMLYFIAGHLGILFAPFIKSWNKNAHWNYIKSVGFSIGRSALFSGVLYLGLVLALLALESLFDIKISGKRYGQLFVFCLGTVNTWIYLSDFPKQILLQTTIYFHKALEVFVKYILIPLVLLYLIILYAYSLKILIQWELPQGWVSYLVTALAILGFAVQHIIDPIQKTLKSWSINTFHPWFYILLLPMVVLLFVAIFRRIDDYGFTENRYFVLLLAFWILGVTLYLLFSKGKRLKVLSISLFILALLSSFGFWGTFSISEKSQINQFKKVYLEVMKSDKLANQAQYRQLTSIIDYLADRKLVSKLDPIIGFSTHSIRLDTIENSKITYHHNTPQILLDHMDIKIDPDINFNYNDLYYNLYDGNTNSHSYPISGFDYFAELNFSDSGDNDIMEIGELWVKFDEKNTRLLLLDPKKKDTLLVIPIENKLRKLAKHGYNLNNAKKEELTITSSAEGIYAKVVLTQLGFYMDRDSISLHNGEIFLFLKQQ